MLINVAGDKSLLNNIPSICQVCSINFNMKYNTVNDSNMLSARFLLGINVQVRIYMHNNKYQHLINLYITILKII